MSMVRNIGIAVKTPSKSCEDLDCPFHGSLPIRGILQTGTIIKKKMNKTVVIEKKYQIYIRKFKRYERRRTRMMAHLPPCIDADVGDRVRIGECRPLSKNVSFVVLEKVV